MSTATIAEADDLHLDAPTPTGTDPRCSPALGPVGSKVMWASWLSRRPLPPPEWRPARSHVLVVAETHRDRQRVERALQCDALRCHYRLVDSLQGARDHLAGAALCAQPGSFARPSLIVLDLDGDAARAEWACGELQRAGLLDGVDVVAMRSGGSAEFGSEAEGDEESTLWQVDKPADETCHVAVLRDLVIFGRPCAAGR